MRVQQPHWARDIGQMRQIQIDIPRPWQELNLDLRGLLMVVGKADVGKTTFARYLYERLSGPSRIVGYLDGDPGQSTLGPPCTLTLALAREGDQSFPPQGAIWRSFVGSTSPRGHMLQLVICAARLVGAGLEAGAEVIIYDTSGLVDPGQGGINLKMAKVDLLHPQALLAIQEDRELEPLLRPLRQSRRVRVLDLPSSPSCRRRDIEARRAHRAKQFAQYFANANLLKVQWPKFAVFPAPCFEPNRLVALEDPGGFTLGLGIVEEPNRGERTVLILTPLSSTDLDRVDAIRLGDVVVDLQTFEDRCLADWGKMG